METDKVQVEPFGEKMTLCTVRELESLGGKLLNKASKKKEIISISFDGKIYEGLIKRDLHGTYKIVYLYSPQNNIEEEQYLYDRLNEALDTETEYRELVCDRLFWKVATVLAVITGVLLSFL